MELYMTLKEVWNGITCKNERNLSHSKKETTTRQLNSLHYVLHNAA